MPESNIVYVGQKPVMNYVLATITLFHRPNVNEVRIIARGRAISRSVDVAEIVRKRFLTDIKVRIETGTELLHLNDGHKLNTSTIEIVLARGGD